MASEIEIYKTDISVYIKTDNGNIYFLDHWSDEVTIEMGKDALASPMIKVSIPKEAFREMAEHFIGRKKAQRKDGKKKNAKQDN